MAAQSRQAWQNRYGETEAAKMESHLQAFVAERPTLAKTLGGGLAQHPEVTQMLSGPVRRSLGLF